MKWILLLLVIVLLVMHQDVWNWSPPTPGDPAQLLFGFLPIGLWYQALFTVLCALLMTLLVRWAWPTHLEAAESESVH